MSVRHEVQVARGSRTAFHREAIINHAVEHLGQRLMTGRQSASKSVNVYDYGISKTLFRSKCRYDILTIT